LNGRRSYERCEKQQFSPLSLSTPNGYFINTIKEEEEDGQGEWGKIS
jgi:hypothetical protein